MLLILRRPLIPFRNVSLSPRRLLTTHSPSDISATSTFFTRIPTNEITPRNAVQIAGREFLPGSQGEGFPKFLGSPRDDLPYTLRVAYRHQLPLKDLSEKCRDVIDEVLPLYGAVLFRGLPLTSAVSFADFASGLGFQPLSYEGGLGNRSAVDSIDNVFTSSDEPKEFNIMPHNEMASYTNYPQKIVFFCHQAPFDADSGGLTPLSKNSDVLAKLDCSIVDTLQEKKIRYLVYLPDQSKKTYSSWQKCFCTSYPKEAERFLDNAGFEYQWNKQDNSLTYSYIRPALIPHPVTGDLIWFNQVSSHHNTYMKALPSFQGVELPNHMYPIHTTYGNGDEIEPEVIQHIRDTKWRYAVGFPWRNGDVLVLDNMAVMHARLAFLGDRKILTYLVKV